MMKRLSAIAIATAALAAPMLSHAESTTTTPAQGPTPGPASTATAHVDVTVTVPAVLYLRVGTGNAIGAANNATVDGMTFTVPAANLGDSTVVNAAAGNGDLGSGAVTVRVYSNLGDVSLNSSVAGPLSDGAGDTISWNQISVVGAALASGTTGFTNAAITHPAFNTTAGGGSGTATTLTATSKLARFEGKWTYSYANGVVVPAGTYGSTVANHGRITYTATQL
ncbi:MAG TPA: hypothetical protein VHA82_06520 [Ramlibacter sp.]|uniref:hypothetical protein n=1 Tax=Ramlibacter sp. TaxID=1917967 RepID=UPI002BCB491B|nr:hypothetical protein [Ramlibacter sp.]HVZ43449.1 hypothetical protein [Ramlibacter sp.]